MIEPPRGEKPGLFDRFAGWTGGFVSRAPFFGLCVFLVLVWPVSFFFLEPDTAQLIINTATTIVTFLLVALLENTQSRADKAVQTKLNATADALADLLEVMGDELGTGNFTRHATDLRDAVGLEERVSS